MNWEVFLGFPWFLDGYMKMYVGTIVRWLLKESNHRTQSCVVNENLFGIVLYLILNYFSTLVLVTLGFIFDDFYGNEANLYHLR